MPGSLARNSREGGRPLFKAETNTVMGRPFGVEVMVTAKPIQTDTESLKSRGGRPNKNNQNKTKQTLPDEIIDKGILRFVCLAVSGKKRDIEAFHTFLAGYVYNFTH